MADKKVTDLTDDTTPTANDLVLVVDVETSASKKVKVSNLPLGGSVVQEVTAPTTASATGTTLIPLDDTIPQITEGNEFMTVAITPKYATSTLIIEATVFLASSAGNSLIAALFQDAVANALASNVEFQGTANAPMTVPLKHTMTAGTTSAITFRVRAGGNGASTVTFNGLTGARLFGAITKSTLTVREVKV